MARRVEVARRAMLLLTSGYCVTYWYALAACEEGLIDDEDLRGVGPRGHKRYYLA